MSAPPPVTLAVPPSKSITHRALLLAARADGPSVLANPLLGADCLATLAALEALGTSVRHAVSMVNAPELHLTPVAAWQAPSKPLDCANSGTTLRLLAAAVALADFPVVLDGDASLRRRSSLPLVAALRSLGAQVSCDDAGRSPLTVCGPLGGGTVRLAPRVSSQFASGLILALALGPHGGAVHLEAPVDSAPYLHLTVEVAAAFDLAIRLDTALDGSVVLRAAGGQVPRGRRYAVEGDWSTAAFGLVGGALLGRAVRLTGLRAQSVQGDRAVVAALAAFGLAPRFETAADPSAGAATLVLDPAPLRAAGTLALGPTPDLFPALCALAARAPGTTTLVGAPSLRHKESDRIAVMAQGLRALGVACDERPDGLVVHGRPVGAPPAAAAQSGPPPMLDAAGDHRVHMALATLVAAMSRDAAAGFTADAVEVGQPDSAAVSHPGFAQELELLRGF